MIERSYRSWLPQLSTWSVLTCLVLHQPEVILPLCVPRKEVEKGGGGGRWGREVGEGGGGGRWRREVEKGGGGGRWGREVEEGGGGGRWRREVKEGGEGGRCKREVEEGGEEVKRWRGEEVER